MSKKKRNLRHNKFHLLTDSPQFNTIESYKTARTNLQFKLMNSDDKRCIAFTSSFASEGKTTVCINLAVTFAQTGSKVLIIDADMRCPAVHRYLKVQSSPGLSDKICGFADDQPCVYRTDIENLFVMPAGSIPPNPTELLMSSRMDSFLKVFLNSFDYVFIDAPPVGIVTDAAVIGSKCGGVIMVARQGISRKDKISAALQSLKLVDVNIYGFILNDYISDNNKKYGRYGKYGKGYYGSYYGQYKKDNKLYDNEK